MVESKLEVNPVAVATVFFESFKITVFLKNYNLIKFKLIGLFKKLT